MQTERQVQLILAAQKGDAEAANTLFSEIYNDVYFFARKTVQDDNLACDITQEALIDIFNHLNDLKDPVAFPAWSRRITYHQCTRYFRKRKDIPVGEDEEGASLFDTIEEENAEFIPDEALDQKDFRQTIMKFVDNLPEEQRSAVLLYYFDELSVSDIADIQGVSVGTVKSRLNYARKAIRAQVEEYEKKHQIKLHAIPFMPFIQWLFHPEKLATVLPEAVAESIAAAAEVSGAGIAVGAAGTAATTTATATTAATATTTAAATATTAATAATTAAVTTATAATATAATAAAVAIPVTAKIVVAVAAAAAITAGGVGISSVVKNQPSTTTTTTAITTTYTQEETAATSSLFAGAISTEAPTETADETDTPTTPTATVSDTTQAETGTTQTITEATTPTKATTTTTEATTTTTTATTTTTTATTTVSSFTSSRPAVTETQTAPSKTKEQAFEVEDTSAVTPSAVQSGELVIVTTESSTTKQWTTTDPSGKKTTTALGGHTGGTLTTTTRTPTTGNTTTQTKTYTTETLPTQTAATDEE